MLATRGAVVSMNYTLTDDEGTVIDSNEGCAPLFYLHGYENIISGLESALDGVGPGHKAMVVVEPADGYGEVDQDAIFEVPKDQFPADPPVAVGMRFSGETPSGEVPLVVVGVSDDAVKVDANHPLAGKRLHFDVEVLDVRAATDQELSLGYPE